MASQLSFKMWVKKAPKEQEEFEPDYRAMNLYLVLKLGWKLNCKFNPYIHCKLIRPVEILSVAPTTTENISEAPTNFYLIINQGHQCLTIQGEDVLGFQPKSLLMNA